MATVLAIPDLHVPFHHKHAFEYLEYIADTYKPDKIVCLGDAMDGHAMSYHESDPNGRSSGDEYYLASMELEKLWNLFPEGKGCFGNHDRLPQRKLFSAGLPEILLKSMGEIMCTPDTWQWDHRHEIDGVQYIHGQCIGLKTSIQTAPTQHQQSTVFGHVHAHAGVYYMQNHAGKRIFGLNSGCLIDDDAYAFKYGKFHATRPILGCSIIVDGEEGHFLPMPKRFS
jgi:hypothetical protein